MKIEDYNRMLEFNIGRKHKDEEHRLQKSCVEWFNAAYPKYAKGLFAVPNGGRRDVVTAKRLKDEGVLAGVADLILSISRGGFNMLCIEMKTPKGRQSENQKKWQSFIEKHGPAKYVIVRSLEQFINEINDYINLN